MTGITFLSLLSLTVLSGTVLAGNTSKAVYFGSGPFPAPSFGYDDNYSLSFTPVNGGGVTSTFVTVQNKASGTLNHVILQGGTQAPDPRANANFIPDGTNGSAPICTAPPAAITCIPSLPNGLSYVAAYAPSGHPCTIYDAAGLPAPTGPGISCDVGQLVTNASLTFRFAIQVPAFVPPTNPNVYQTWLTVSGNEGTSNQGSNQDAFFALGDINVGPNTPCSDANFFTAGSFTGFGAPTCDQPSTLTGGSFANGAFAQVKVYNDNLCLSGYKCFGKRVDATVEFGVPVTGGLQWTVMWQKSSLNGTPKGFIHFLDAYLAGTDLTAYEIINFKSTAQCPATITSTTTLPCLNGKPGFVTVDGISYFRAVFTTGANGAGRGT